MKRRYLYALMYAVPTLIFSTIVMVVVTVSIASVLWIFVYGDNPWPSFVNRNSPIFMATVLAIVWLALLYAVFTWGKRQETHAFLDMKHVYLAAGTTGTLVLLLLLHQLSVGNIGAKPDVVVCSDFCTAKKFNASRFPQDETCRCYSSNGSETLNISMSRIRSK